LLFHRSLLPFSGWFGDPSVPCTLGSDDGGLRRLANVVRTSRRSRWRFGATCHRQLRQVARRGRKVDKSQDGKENQTMKVNDT